MSLKREYCCSAVHALVLWNDQVLLGKRKNTGYCDGYYAFPAGHIERFETAQKAIARELEEEAGITPIFNELTAPILTTEHLKDYGEEIKPEERFSHYFEHFFVVTAWNGLLANRELNKCEDLRFFSQDALPSPLMPLAAHALEYFRQENAPHFSRFGWDNPAFRP